jgi:hypothetical protein
VPNSEEIKPYGKRNAANRNIHQKNCEFPIAATGAAASATNTTQITDKIALIKLNFFFFSPIVFFLSGTRETGIEDCLNPRMEIILMNFT